MATQVIPAAAAAATGGGSSALSSELQSILDVANQTTWLASRSSVVRWIAEEDGATDAEGTVTFSTEGTIGKALGVYPIGYNQWQRNAAGMPASVYITGDLQLRAIFVIGGPGEGGDIVSIGVTGETAATNFLYQLEFTALGTLDFFYESGSGVNHRHQFTLFGATVGDVWYVDLVREDNGDGTCTISMYGARNGGDYAQLELLSTTGTDNGDDTCTATNASGGTAGILNIAGGSNALCAYVEIMDTLDATSSTTYTDLQGGTGTIAPVVWQTLPDSLLGGLSDTNSIITAGSLTLDSNGGLSCELDMSSTAEGWNNDAHRTVSVSAFESEFGFPAGSIHDGSYAIGVRMRPRTSGNLGRMYVAIALYEDGGSVQAGTGVSLRHSSNPQDFHPGWISGNGESFSNPGYADGYIKGFIVYRPDASAENYMSVSMFDSTTDRAVQSNDDTGTVAITEASMVVGLHVGVGATEAFTGEVEIESIEIAAIPVTSLVG